MQSRAAENIRVIYLNKNAIPFDDQMTNHSSKPKTNTDLFK